MAARRRRREAVGDIRRSKRGESPMGVLAELAAPIGVAVPTTRPLSTQAPPRRMSCALDLSKSRATDAALDILRAYKLTGNFHVNLEIVLKHLGALGEVTFEFAPTSARLHNPDCRHVVFRPDKNIGMERFDEIMRAVRGLIG
jgi:hypothetical protein